VVDEEVTRQHRDPALGGAPRHGLGVADAQGERLLHEARPPRLDALQRDRRVRRRRGRDHDRVYAPEQVGDIARDVRRGVLARHLLAHSWVGIAHRRERHVGERRRCADVVLPPRARADDAELHPTHR
jgi:hypothetical protein